jgi:hypothetical protein
MQPLGAANLSVEYTSIITEYIVGSIWKIFRGRQLPGGLRACRDGNVASNMQQAVLKLLCDVEDRRENLRFHIRKHLGVVNTA